MTELITTFNYLLSEFKPGDLAGLRGFITTPLTWSADKRYIVSYYDREDYICESSDVEYLASEYNKIAKLYADMYGID